MTPSRADFSFSRIKQKFFKNTLLRFLCQECLRLLKSSVRRDPSFCNRYMRQCGEWCVLPERARARSDVWRGFSIASSGNAHASRESCFPTRRHDHPFARRHAPRDSSLISTIVARCCAPRFAGSVFAREPKSAARIISRSRTLINKFVVTKKKTPKNRRSDSDVKHLYETLYANCFFFFCKKRNERKQTEIWWKFISHKYVCLCQVLITILCFAKIVFFINVWFLQSVQKKNMR